MTIVPAWLTRVRALLLDHDSRHEDGGLDEIDLTGLSGMPGDLASHATRHEADGADEMDLTDLSGKDDIVATEITADHTLADTYNLILCDCNGGDIIITIPLAATYPKRRWHIKKIDASRHVVKVQTSASSGVYEKLDDEKEWVIDFRYNSMMIAGDGVSAFAMI